MQVSDRRLSSAGSPATDESTKATIFCCDSGRLIVGYTGLAVVGAFKTQTWIQRLLRECAPPDYFVPMILSRFERRASDDFARMPIIRALKPEDKRLTIMLSGFLATDAGPLAHNIFITNYQNFDTGYDDGFAWDAFNTWVFIAPNNIADAADVQRIGNLTAMPESELVSIRSMLARGLPIKDVVQRTCAAIRDAADRPQSGGAIGKNLMSVIVPADFSQVPTGAYHSAVTGDAVFMPDVVTALRSQGSVIFRDAMIRTIGADAPPLVVPPQRRRSPCACGSGKLYKNCHGR